MYNLPVRVEPSTWPILYLRVIWRLYGKCTGDTGAPKGTQIHEILCYHNRLRTSSFNFKNHTSTGSTTFPFGLYLPHDPFCTSEWFEVRRESVQGTVVPQSIRKVYVYWLASYISQSQFGILKMILLGGVQPSRSSWTFNTTHFKCQSDLKFVRKVYRGQWGHQSVPSSLTIQIPQWITHAWI